MGASQRYAITDGSVRQLRENEQHACTSQLLSVTIGSAGMQVGEAMPLFVGATTYVPTHWTYRLLGDAGRVIYVGRSRHFLNRIGQHGTDSTKSWQAQVRRIELDLWCCHDKAALQEARLIHELRPVKNILHNVTRLGGRRVSGCVYCEASGSAVES